MLLNSLIDRLERRFNEAGLAYGHTTESAREEAIWIVLHVLGYDPGTIREETDIPWGRDILPEELDAVDAVAGRRVDERIPFPYICNETWFAGNRFYIDERAIIPRSYIGEWIPDAFQPWVDPDKVGSILDLCTGCGCIAISCALAFPDARMVASDLSGDALDVARINVENYGLEDRVTLVRADGFKEVEGRFDMIVSNPPYVSDSRMDRLPDEYRNEPELAFRGGADGLDFISRVLLSCGDKLSGNGVLFMEAGSASHALEERFPSVPFTWLSTEYDEMVVFMLTADDFRKYGGCFKEQVPDSRVFT